MYKIQYLAYTEPSVPATRACEARGVYRGNFTALGLSETGLQSTKLSPCSSHDGNTNGPRPRFGAGRQHRKSKVIM